jgi:C-terminal peptidase prc
VAAIPGELNSLSEETGEGQAGAMDVYTGSNGRRQIMIIARFAMVVLSCCLLFGPAAADETQAVNAMLDSVERAHIARDAALLADQCYDRCTFLGENPDPVVGAYVFGKTATIDSIQSYVWKSPDFEKRTLADRHIVVRGDLAFIRATSTDTYKDGKAKSTPTYYIATKRASGWQMCFAMPAIVAGESRVTRVEPGSAADKAGLRSGDVLTMCNGDELDPMLVGSDVVGYIKSKALGGPITLAVLRSTGVTRIQMPDGFSGATVQATLIPAGKAVLAPADALSPVKTCLGNEIDALKTGDCGCYKDMLCRAGFFSYRRDAEGRTTIVGADNAEAAINKQVEESRKALKPSSIELKSIDVIATGSIAVVAGNIDAVLRDGSPLHTLTRLQVFVRRQNDWLLAADLVDRYRLTSGGDAAVTLSPEETREAERSVEGKMVGIGVKLSKTDDGVFVDQVLPDSPAEASGLKNGDVIESVDGRDLAALTIKQAIAAITGDAGTQVQIVYRDASGARRNLSITRGVVKITGVQSSVLDDRVGYLGLTGFSKETAEAVKGALSKTITPQTARGIVIDLRGCSGGLYAEVVKVAGMLIDGSPPKTLWIVRPKNKNPEPVQLHSKALTSLPLVVLTDSKTAGAAELLAEALRQHTHAVLIGTKTAGAASLRERIAKPDGSSEVKQTGDFLFPSTGKTGTDGVVPDISVPADSSPDNVLAQARQALIKLANAGSGDSR